MSTISRYRLNAERQNDGVLTCRLYGFNMWDTSNQSAMPIAYMGIGTRAHRIIAIIPISIVTIRIMHAISILYSSLCSLNAAMRTMALTSAIIPIPFHNHESSCINCIVVTSLYYRVVVIRAPLQGLCYNVRDAVDWFSRPTARRFQKGSNHSPLQYC